MERVVIAVIMHEGRVLVEELREDVRNAYGGVPAVLPGGKREATDVSDAAAVQREILQDLGISVAIVGVIATRVHPLVPNNEMIYLHCAVVGEIPKSPLHKKIKTIHFADVMTAARMMLTLYTKVFAYLLRQLDAMTLKNVASYVELPWYEQNLEAFGNRVRQGELVAFPTETVYGLGADATSESAAAKIFAAKRRPADNPLIVHVSSLDEIEKVAASVSPTEAALFQHFSPGPLTVLLKKSTYIPDLVTAKSKLVGVRIPNLSFALELLQKAEVPIAAPSANISGKPSATHHKHVQEYFSEPEVATIRAGATPLGVESTVVLAPNDEEIQILRQGAITEEEIQAQFPNKKIHIPSKRGSANTPVPGSKYRHYAPKGKIHLVPVGSVAKTAQKITKLLGKLPKDTTIVLCTEEVAQKLAKSAKKIILGSESEFTKIVGNLYHALIECDARRVEHIIAQSYAKNGLGATIMERLTRAAEPA
ncbi:MAG: L-threonylcarbamoyladenylate synthase [Candidatus Dojkabacteria bacterium]|nr:MAG: L-threonylcarbamoyladenylate synthase [Candidatus Dojkabacteria bacterium]